RLGPRSTFRAAGRGRRGLARFSHARMLAEEFSRVNEPENDEIAAISRKCWKRQALPNRVTTENSAWRTANYRGNCLRRCTARGMSGLEGWPDRTACAISSRPKIELTTSAFHQFSCARNQLQVGLLRSRSGRKNRESSVDLRSHGA